MFRNRRRLWKVRATPLRAIVCCGCPAIDCPAKRTSPELGLYTPVITLKTVVLPAPFGPIRLTISPSPTSRSSSEIARRPPKDNERRSRFRTDPAGRPPSPGPGCPAGDPPAGQPGPGDGGRPAGSVLNLDRLSLSFGGLRAISELDLLVGDGEIVSLIGPNGAGKTTVFNVITGVYKPSSGDVRFAGQSIAGQPQHTIARRGVARTFQSLRLFLN